MKYKAEHPSRDLEKALDLDSAQVKRLIGAIQKAYRQEWNIEGPNIDQIYGKVAPYIKTQEEAFFVANTVLTDVFGAMEQMRKENVN